MSGMPVDTSPEKGAADNAPRTRQRTPTITIDTTVAIFPHVLLPLRLMLGTMIEFGGTRFTSSSIHLTGPGGSGTSVRRNKWAGFGLARLMDVGESSGVSSTSRQVSASHAHTSSVASNLLSVPTTHQRSGSFGSSGTSVTSVFTPASSSSPLASSVIEDDHSTQSEFLKLDNEEEIPDNPFAFTPKQLAKLHDPKNLEMLRRMGGLEGLVYGLRTNVKAGLSADEDHLDGKITYRDVVHELETRRIKRVKEDIHKKSIADDDTSTSEKLKEDKQGDLRRKDSSASAKRKFSLASRTTTLSVRPSGGFSDRKRIFSENRIPIRPPKNVFQLMWMALNDKILVLMVPLGDSDLRFF